DDDVPTLHVPALAQALPKRLESRDTLPGWAVQPADARDLGGLPTRTREAAANRQSGPGQGQAALQEEATTIAVHADPSQSLLAPSLGSTSNGDSLASPVFQLPPVHAGIANHLRRFATGCRRPIAELQGKNQVVPGNARCDSGSRLLPSDPGA